MTYDALKSQVDNSYLRAIMRAANDNPPAPYSNGSSHSINSKLRSYDHPLACYEMIVKQFFKDNDQKTNPIPEAEIVFQWKYCPQCRQVRTQRLVGYHEAEQLAYVRDIVLKDEHVEGGI